LLSVSFSDFPVFFEEGGAPYPPFFPPQFQFTFELRLFGSRPQV